jgi:predicted dehydrogenase
VRRALRVAVVGADPSGRGFGARAHVPAVQAVDGLELAAVCTAHPDTARRAAARWRADRWFADYREVAEDPDIDLVTVAVRVRAHRAIVEAALAGGKLVYCEWPLCLSSAEAEPLVRLAADQGLACAAGTQGRFAPAVRFLKQLLDQGVIGRPLAFQASQLLARFAVESDRPWLAREDEGSGALQVATAHLTDTLQYLLGELTWVSGLRVTRQPEDHYADTGAPFRWTAADTVSYVGLLDGGTLGSCLVSNLADPAAGFSLRILGEEGQFLLAAPGYVSFSPAQLLHGAAGDDGLREVAVPGRHRPDLAVPERSAGFNVALALEALARAHRDGTPFHPDFADALRLHRVIEAVARSAETRAGVALVG